MRVIIMDNTETKDDIPTSRPSGDAEKMSSSDTETEKTYPPKKVVLPTMLALFLVFFLVALVNHSLLTLPTS